PVCVINTNLTKDKIPESFGKDVTKLIANVLSKPENFITVSLKTDKQMWKNGSSSPLASVDIWSIGVFNKENNDIYTPKFFKFFSEKLGLPEDRQ
ncbi:hypothetical protein HELRODRAFT_147095, partial [Helobdella robusta]|uniref:D-dopachrome decarboxylase n=1 Tax=Helobdella robusta TaxID=6412 RepID=T1EJW8_HELRO